MVIGEPPIRPCPSPCPVDMSVEPTSGADPTQPDRPVDRDRTERRSMFKGLFRGAFKAVNPARPASPLNSPRKELDGLTTRSKVIAILSDVGEAAVSRHFSGLAVAAFSGSLSERLVRLLRP